jgi:hypothetical protein
MIPGRAGETHAAPLEETGSGASGWNHTVIIIIVQW